MDFELWWLLPIAAAVLRAGLDRRAHRHQAPAARIARAAAVVLPRPQLPAERAARQGDRVVHRGGQGRSADDRPALRAGLAVPPPGRDRPRDPHAPEPARPPRPARRQAQRPRPSSSRRTSIARDCSIAPRSCSPGSTARRSSIRRSGTSSQIYETEKDWPKAISRDAADGGARQAAVLTRRSRNTTASLRRRRCCATHVARRPSARSSRRCATHRGCARANLVAGDLAAQQGDLPAAVAAWQRIESQNPAFLALVADRFADAYRKLDDLRDRHARAAQLPGAISVARSPERAVHADRWSTKGPTPAATLIKDELARNPTLLGLDRLLEAQLLAAPAERRHDLELVKELVAPAHQAPRPVSLRAMRLSRQAVLLALPRLPEMGDVFARGARETPGRLRMDGHDPHAIPARACSSRSTFATSVRALGACRPPRSGVLRLQGRQGAVRRRRARAGALAGRPRLQRLPRSQVSRHSEHRGAGLRRGDAAWRLAC